MVTIASPADIQLLLQRGWISPNQSFDTLRDTTIIHTRDGDINGMVCVRPMYYAHTMVLSPSSRLIADRLFEAGKSLARANYMHGTIFQVAQTNARMREFMESRHAVVEPDSLLYRYDLLPGK